MPRDVYIISACLCRTQGKVCVAIVAYIHIGVGSALLVSTTWAMRRPRKVRRVTGTGSHAFFIVIFNRYIADFGELIGT